MVAGEKNPYLYVLYFRKREILYLVQKKNTKEFIFSGNNTLLADVAYLLTRMVFQRK